MAEVRDAIILAGGIGTRMLPASLFAPKEILPLVDTPLINHLIWEAAKAGATRVHIVLSERKKVFLEQFIGGNGIHGNEVRVDLPRESQDDDGVRPDLPSEALSLGIKGMNIKIHIQQFAGGVGDAISTTKEYIEGPFLVLLGDNLLINQHVGPEHSGKEHASGASLELVQKYVETGLPCVGVSRVLEEDVRNFGIIGFEGSKVSTIVEKPEPNNAPSDFALCGRYLFPGNTFEILEQHPISEFGENQSIALLMHLIENGGIEAVKYSEYQLYDSGNPISWIKAQIDHALRRQDIGEEIRNWVEERVSVGDCENDD